MIDLQQKAECVYCGSESTLMDANAFHPYVEHFGPFSIYVCQSCRSVFTFPVPTESQLLELYTSYDAGMFEKVAALRRQFPLHAWFNQCLSRIRTFFPDPMASFTWIDVGAGEGVMSRLMLNHYPRSRGIAIDFHDRPNALDTLSVEWRKMDLNKPWEALPEANLIFSITVLEHMANPHSFLSSMLETLAKDGVMYLNCPRTDALAFRLLGEKWPYYLPGEHISIPSRKGMKILAGRVAGSSNLKDPEIAVSSVIMPYPLGYYLGYYFNWKKSRYWFNPSIYIPTGMLECMVSGKLNN
jgi:hypothetical protein